MLSIDLKNIEKIINCYLYPGPNCALPGTLNHRGIVLLISNSIAGIRRYKYWPTNLYSKNFTLSIGNHWEKYCLQRNLYIKCKQNGIQEHHALGCRGESRCISFTSFEALKVEISHTFFLRPELHQFSACLLMSILFNLDVFTGIKEKLL